MKCKAMAAALVCCMLIAADAVAGNCHRVGPNISCDDGTTYRQSGGNSYRGNDGTTLRRRNGNTYLGSDGSTYRENGLNIMRSDGSRKKPGTGYRSDGTTCRKEGPLTYCEK